jgi:hypothetical protein
MKTWNLTKQNLPNLIQKINELDFSKRWKIVFYEQTEKRSNEQNERLWGYLYPNIGRHFGYNSSDIHNICKYKFLKTEVVVENEVIPVLKSTTKLNVKEFTEYMENVEQWAIENGWSPN